MKNAGVGERAPRDDRLARDVDAGEAEAGQARRRRPGSRARGCARSCSAGEPSATSEHDRGGERDDHEQRRSRRERASGTSRACRARRRDARLARGSALGAGRGASRRLGVRRRPRASSAAGDDHRVARAGELAADRPSSPRPAARRRHRRGGARRGPRGAACPPRPGRRRRRPARRASRSSPASPSATSNRTAVMLSSPPRSFAALISARVAGVEVARGSAARARRSSSASTIVVRPSEQSRKTSPACGLDA